MHDSLRHRTIANGESLIGGSGMRRVAMLRLEVEEQDATRLAVGQAMTASLPGGKTVIGRGRLARLSTRLEKRTIGPEDGRVRAESRIRAAWADWQPEPDRSLSLGQRAEAVIDLPPHPVAARLPRSAIQVHDARAWVRLVKAFGAFESPVTLGEADDQFVEVMGIAVNSEVLGQNR